MDIPYIIVAGGRGRRMNSDIPKQYLEVDDKPIIYYTIANLIDAGIKRFILVIDLHYLDYLKEKLNDLNIDVLYASGGNERFESVVNGLELLSDEDEYVGIHDCVRPFVDKNVIDRLHSSLRNDENTTCVIPALPVKDTIKFIEGKQIVSTIDRSKVVRVGTPQLVKVREYLKAIHYIGDKIECVTDDASIMEMAGYRVTTVRGSEESFKITDDFDFQIFKYILGRKNENRDRL